MPVQLIKVWWWEGGGAFWTPQTDYCSSDYFLGENLFWNVSSALLLPCLCLFYLQSGNLFGGRGGLLILVSNDATFPENPFCNNGICIFTRFDVTYSTFLRMWIVDFQWLSALTIQIKQNQFFKKWLWITELVVVNLYHVSISLLEIFLTINQSKHCSQINNVFAEYKLTWLHKEEAQWHPGTPVHEGSTGTEMAKGAAMMVLLQQWSLLCA